MSHQELRVHSQRVEPRQHHIVPTFYLAGFTPTLEVDGRFLVFRYATAKHYPSTPRKACRERDYYRFNSPDIDPHHMERLMAWHEGAVAPFIRQIAADGRVTDRRQVAQALALAGLLAARGRAARRRLEATIAVGVVKALRSGTVTRAEWERYRQDELTNGAAPGDCPDYDVARERALRGGWLPRAPRAVVIGLIPHAQEHLMKMLARRSWELMVTDASRNGGFVTSDGPVVWGSLDRTAMGSDTSLDDPSVEITFPVTKDAALISYPGARDSNCDATDEVVAHVNARTVHATDGIVMHADDDFLLRRGNGEIRHGSEYFRYMRDARRRGILRP